MACSYTIQPQRHAHRYPHYRHPSSKKQSQKFEATSEVKEPYKIHDRDWDRCCFQGFIELYEAEQLFDVTLSVDSKEFKAHRVFLAAASDYFRAMFTSDLAEKDQKVIKMNGVDAKSVELVIKYLYTGEVFVTSDTVQNLLSAANLFQLTDLKQGCANFMMQKLDIDNCIGIHFFAQLHKCESLEMAAWDIITENFTAVTRGTEFMDLNALSLVEVIRYDDIQTTEEEVFDVTMRWLKYDLDNRKSDIYTVFSQVRFTLIDEHYFFDIIKNSQMLKGDCRLQLVFDEVVRYKLLKSRWMETDMRMEPRYGADFCRVVVYTSYCDDEKKQVLQVYGQRSDEATQKSGNIMVDIPCDMENPALLVTGENELYLAGGESSGSVVYKWSAEECSFEELASLSIPRKQFCLAEVDKGVYALGGCNQDSNLQCVSRYNIEEDEWEDVSPMPKALRCFCAIPYQGKLYVFGGESEKISKKSCRGKKEITKSVLCYDPRDDKWTVLRDMPTPRALAGCAIYNKKIYVIGGFSSITESWMKDKSPENCLSSVDMYDVETDSWEPGPKLPCPLCAMGVVKYCGTIYILGGENEDDVSSKVFLLNAEHKWEFKDEMIAGVTETTVHSVYSVINIEIE